MGTGGFRFRNSPKPSKVWGIGFRESGLRSMAMRRGS